jgi:hypothetical protein
LTKQRVPSSPAEEDVEVHQIAATTRSRGGAGEEECAGVRAVGEVESGAVVSEMRHHLGLRHFYTPVIF